MKIKFSTQITTIAAIEKMRQTNRYSKFEYKLCFAVDMNSEIAGKKRREKKLKRNNANHRQKHKQKQIIIV